VDTSYALFCVRGTGDTRHSSFGRSTVPVGPPLALTAEKPTSRKAPIEPTRCGRMLQVKDANIVGYYAPATGIRVGEGLGHQDGAELRAGAK